jgi:hypothetical protein
MYEPQINADKQVGVNKRHTQKSGFTEVTRLQGPLRVLGLIVLICLNADESDVICVHLRSSAVFS